MPYFQEDDAHGHLPAKDNNVTSPTPPADHVQVTPEFVQELIEEIDEVGKQIDDLWAEKYGTKNSPSPVGPGYRAPYAKVLDIERKMHTLEVKRDALRNQVRQYTTLIAPPDPQDMSVENPSMTVGEKISKLRHEGKPPKQAQAIALDMQRRGKLKK